ncbi:MAG TPA: CcmD family protein [Spirochaetota bacterium]|nr:CcmD family protein [Spirochaetota bacterium]
MISNPLFFVFIVVLIIWIGIALLLFRIDRKISLVEKQVSEALDEK